MRESENEAWQRADAMEERYDRMTFSRNAWRERSHKQDIYHTRHCRTETTNAERAGRLIATEEPRHGAGFNLKFPPPCDSDSPTSGDITVVG